MNPKFLQSWMDFWWVRIPAWLHKRSEKLSRTLSDGLYLSAWPYAGAFGPLLALFTGWFIGKHYFLPAETYTYSLIILAILMIVSGLGAGLGSWMWLGYVMGDFFIERVSYYSFYEDKFHFILKVIEVQLALCIGYALLAILLILIPSYRRHLCETLAPWTTVFEEKYRERAKMVFQALFDAGLIYLWTQAVTVLIRPVFIWNGGNEPPTEAIEPVQKTAWVLVLLGVSTGIARTWLESRGAVHENVARKVRLLKELPPLVRKPKPVWWFRWKAYALKPALMVFLLSGMLKTWQEAYMLAVALAVVFLLWDRWRQHLRAWSALMDKIPVLLRLLIGTAASFLLSYKIVALWWDNDQESFQPMLIALVASQIIFSLLVPSIKRQMAPDRK